MFLSPIPTEELDGNLCMQSSYWARLKEKHGWEAYAFRMRKSTLLVLVRRFLRFFTFAYVPFGPQEDVDLSRLSRQLVPFLPKHLFVIRYDLPYGSGAEGRSLVVQQESVQPDATVVIDLKPGYETVCSGYRQRARRALQKSKDRVLVKLWDGDEETFRQWYGVYLETGSRDGFSTRSEAYLRDVLSLSDAKVESRLFVAWRDGKVVGGTILLANQREAIYLFGASKRMPDCTCSYALQDAMIQYSIQTGRTVYDLFGVSGNDGRGSHLASLDLFKTAFGGRRIARRPTCDWPADRLVYALFSSAEKIRYRHSRGASPRQ
jgi:lipid II:glycine glycyltransferase (peptidoglycan interpeptide bridge formation enzyme)